MSIGYYGHAYPSYDSRTVYIAPSADVIGDVKIGNDSSVWFQTVIRGDVHHIRIGERTNVQDGSVLHVTRVDHPLLIGSGVTVGHKVILHGCTIEDDCLIGMGAILLDGVHVEPKVLVGAGALVPPGQRLSSGYLYVGSPAKAKRPLSEQELAFFATSADNYVRLKEDYLAS